MVSLFLDPAILCLALYFLSRDTGGEWDFTHVLLVSIGIWFTQMMLILFLGPHIGLFVYIPVIAVAQWLLMHFCHVTWKQAGTALAILFGTKYIFSLVGRALLSS